MSPQNHPRNGEQKARAPDHVDSARSLTKSSCGTRTTLQPISIAVMGTTGSGKSTFINLVSRSTLPVSKGLRSCTQEVHWANEFSIDDRTVQLIDTPGFDDTTKSEVDILKNISAALENHYKAQARLHGVLYLHRVTDMRMGGASMRSFRLFRKMCGDDSLKNTAIVTTMWDKVAPDEAIPREDELKTDPEFFQPALRQQAKLLRHNNTLESAHRIIREIFANHPSPIGIQVELVEEQKHLSDTNAGKDVKGELDRLTLNFRQTIAKLQEELQSEPQSQGGNELQEELRLSEMKLERTMAEIEKLRKNHSLRSRVAKDGQKSEDRGEASGMPEVSDKETAVTFDTRQPSNEYHAADVDAQQSSSESHKPTMSPKPATVDITSDEYGAIVAVNRQKTADIGIITTPSEQGGADGQAEGIETVETQGQRSSAKHHGSKSEIKVSVAGMASSEQKTADASQRPGEENKVSNVDTTSDGQRPAREADKQKEGGKAPESVTAVSGAQQPPNQSHRPTMGQGVGPIPNEQESGSPARVVTPREEPHWPEGETKVSELVETHDTQNSVGGPQQPALEISTEIRADEYKLLRETDKRKENKVPGRGHKTTAIEPHRTGGEVKVPNVAVLITEGAANNTPVSARTKLPGPDKANGPHCECCCRCNIQ